MGTCSHLATHTAYSKGVEYVVCTHCGLEVREAECDHNATHTAYIDCREHVICTHCGTTIDIR